MTSEKNNHKTIIILTLLIAILVMSVGYAQVASNLKIQGATEITGVWKVKIKSMTIKEKAENLTSSDVQVTSITDTVATFSNKFYKPDDFVTFEVTVANEGNIPAYLDSIQNNYTPSNLIIYDKLPELSGDNAIPRSLAPDEEISFLITIRLNPDMPGITEDTITSNLTIGLNYIQKV